MDYELALYDRIEIIKTIDKIHNLKENAYLSFSGGKDSTVLHYLLDIALPDNNIPRVFADTGIEYNDIRNYVYDLAKTDERFVIIKPTQNIKQMLEKVGYPFKSKEHSLRVQQFNKGKNSNFIKKYMRLTDYDGKFVCPKSLLYQFETRGKYNYSNLCCHELKKKPMHQYAKVNKKPIIITGMRAEEGGNRARLDCAIFDTKSKKLIKFHPLIKVDDNWEDEFIKQNNIKLCKLYYEPYNFKRTGCKGCPFALTLQEQLDVMKEYLPNEYKQCELIWKPVYDEYRRLGYRLRKDTGQLNLFDFKE